MVIIHDILDHGCQLLPTLQTRWGMVRMDGIPQDRFLGKGETFFKKSATDIMAVAAHLLQRLPYAYSELLNKNQREILVRELWACTAQSCVTKSTLMRYIKHEKRLDVEQAVAMVLASVPPEVATQLAPLVSDMFISTHMWRERADYGVVDFSSRAAATERKLTRLREVVVSMGAPSTAVTVDEQSLIHVLMRVRRERSGVISCSQRLCFPKYLVSHLPEHERATWTELYTWGLQREVKIQSDSIIRVSKRVFVRIQRWLLRVDGPKLSEKAAFIREVANLEKEIHYGGVRLDSLQNTSDSVALAYSFMAVQRRLQLKVVSDLEWTEFLQKGQGSGMLQNRPDIVTSFEQELARHATDVQALIAIRPPKAKFTSDQHHTMSLDEVILQVDQVCTLMQQYVLLFGGGHFENLRYADRCKHSGGKGRGPVDAYNLLVDLLRTLRKRGNGRFVVGPCHKFLAKNIMAMNDAWKDDAFAPDKIPGWVEWLKSRQKLRISLPDIASPATHIALLQNI